MGNNKSKDAKANFRVILNVKDEKKSGYQAPPKDKGKERDVTNGALPNIDGDALYAITKFNPIKQSDSETKLMPVPIPKVKEPIFKSRPQLFSKE